MAIILKKYASMLHIIFLLYSTLRKQNKFLKKRDNLVWNLEKLINKFNSLLKNAL